MIRAAKLVKAGGGKLLVDVNWRPVFWDDLVAAKKEILAFLDLADIVKISDADLEYLYDMQFVTALLNPCAVSGHWFFGGGGLRLSCDRGRTESQLE
jgi:fructokinase